jgi:hypothetical protein
MAVALDSTSRWPSAEGTSSTVTGSPTTVHNCTGVPRAIIVTICTLGTTAPVASVNCGGTAFDLQASATDTTEAGRVDVYTATTAAQINTTSSGATLTISFNTAIASSKFATINVLTSGQSVSPYTELDTSGVVNTTVGTAAQVSLVTTQDTFSCGGVHHGAAAPSGTPVSGCTLQNNVDYGQLSANTVRRTSIDTAGTLPVGVTIVSDDFCAAAVAIREAGGAPPATLPPHARRVVAPRRPLYRASVQ